MVAPLVGSFVAAAIVALMSSVPVIMSKTGRSPSQFLAGRAQDRSVLFQLTKEQREALLGLRSCTREEFDTLFADISGKLRETYDREGYVIVRGLMDEDLINRLGQAGNVLLKPTGYGKTFASLEFGPVFLSPPKAIDDLSQEVTLSEEEQADEQKLRAFREVSLSSAVPSFIAKMLFGLDEDSDRNVRVLKDVFLAKGKEGEFCGWHVDDFAFWPVSTRATADMPGVNAWIAIDDIPPIFGGGLAVSPRSHKADWRQEAYETIGSTRTYPEEGFETPQEMFAKAKGTTCNMAKVAPELASRLDKTMHVFNFKKGDVLFHTRWLFHRSVPVTKKGARHFEKLGQEPYFRRYSIRYEVGEAKLLRGFSVEGSVVLTPENSGMTLDYVCATDAPWYPKCWPQVDPTELGGMQILVEEKMPEAQALMREKMKDLGPIFRKR